MSATQQRDHVMHIAQRERARALKLARSIQEPWFRAQSLAWVARFSPDSAQTLAKEAVAAAAACDNAYQQCAVRAWAIAALAEIGKKAKATKVLDSVLAAAPAIATAGSKAEALSLLLEAATYIDSLTRSRPPSVKGAMSCRSSLAM